MGLGDDGRVPAYHRRLVQGCARHCARFAYLLSDEEGAERPQGSSRDDRPLRRSRLLTDARPPTQRNRSMPPAHVDCQCKSAGEKRQAWPWALVGGDSMGQERASWDGGYLFQVVTLNLDTICSDIVE